MIINYYLCPSIANCSSITPSMIRSILFMYIIIKYMIINHYLCPLIAYYSSFAPSMIHSII